MPSRIFRLVTKSILFYRKPVIYQSLIIALLAAVITGSLMTGKSVRTSLKQSASERLGNTGILISSGTRYFAPALVSRMAKSGAGINGLLEIKGSVQNLNSQKNAFNVNIYGIDNEFFKFHGHNDLAVKPDEIFINRRLADYLVLNQGDELILRFEEISEIPADAPFAPESGISESIVMRIGEIIEPGQTGNFSLSISQIVPMNVFINLSDLENKIGRKLKTNRILIDKNSVSSIERISDELKQYLEPSDIGLKIRKVKAGGCELISERVFIDDVIIEDIRKLLPSGSPVITYLANSIRSGAGSTPYSFVAALPGSVYKVPERNEIIINKWLSDDLRTSSGDSLLMTWYSPDSLNKLVEKSNYFIVSQVIGMDDIRSDSTLMPDFPGIAGSESCSGWDAGVPVKISAIRDKDEKYWKDYKGTPKALISYEKGKEIWGSNFGPATALRFPSDITVDEINEKLKGSLDPDHTGFHLSNLYDESIRAADESVDFGTLFLSLGFFLILASLVLLSFAVGYFLDSKSKTIDLYYAIGFKNRLIKLILFSELLITGIIGSAIGALTGYLVSIIITVMLNSVWSGAVQTNTLRYYFNTTVVLYGFGISLSMILIFMFFRVRKHLASLKSKESGFIKLSSGKRNLVLLIVSFLITVFLITSAVMFKESEIALSFAAGTLMLITFILAWRHYYIGTINKNGNLVNLNGLSKRYFSYRPSNAITPVLFIAAGIFAVFITSINRTEFGDNQMKRSSGTGGYLLWCESNIALKEDLNSVAGRKSLGLEEDSLSGMRFIEFKRSPGNDASCLNLNHITSPPLLGTNPETFISQEAFSFSGSLKNKGINNPWEYLDSDAGTRTIYGIADQTVLDWGLKIGIGDTLILRAENGQPLNIIIAAGLKSSVFQGFVLIGRSNFIKYFPSVPGNSVFLIDGKPELTDLYKRSLDERLQAYGINTERTTDRLKSFYEVSNTYLSVFGVFGGFGMIIGVAGLGFVLLRNYNSRKREFALMLATGFSFRRIRKMIISEQLLILFAGISSGIVSAIFATLPSIMNNQEIPWVQLIILAMLIAFTGFVAILLSMRSIKEEKLITSLRKE